MDLSLPLQYFHLFWTSISVNSSVGPLVCVTLTTESTAPKSGLNTGQFRGTLLAKEKPVERLCVCEGMTAYTCMWYYESLFACAGVCVSLFLSSSLFLWQDLYILQSVGQLAGPGSARGMVCRTSSSSCRARCRWTSTQHGVCLMVCRG